MPFEKKTPTRSPLKSRTLPQAGESTTRAFWEHLVFKILMLVFLPFGFFCIGIIEWLHYFFHDRPHPMIPTVLFVVASAGALWKGRKAWRELESIGLGIRGERTVGQVLERMRAHGYHVFHDLEEDGYNIDHVLIGPGGVFSIETKTRSKPTSHDGQVIVEGEQLTVDGSTPDRDPITQAKAAARRVKAILLAQTGREIGCSPVVIFPGWYVDRRRASGPVEVMSENYFAKWFPDRPKVLPREEVAFLAANLERYLIEKRKA